MIQQMAKVLVVDSDNLSRELESEILNIYNFTVDTAESAEEAIIKAEKEIYDIILTEIKLFGEIDGVEMAKIIKRNKILKDTTVIALTAYAFKGDRERFLAEGFDDYISKPIDVRGFIEKINLYRA